MQSGKGKYRIGVVNTHPIQYFAPFYAYISRSPDVEIIALYLSDFSLRGERDMGFAQPITWNLNLLSGYPSRMIGKRAGKRTPGAFMSILAPEIWSEIRSGRYDAILLHGHTPAANLVAFAAAKWARLPVLLRGETHLNLHRPRWKRLIRDWILRLIYRHVDQFLAIGSANREYYLSLGIPADRVTVMPYSVDNDRFIADSRLTSEERRVIRSQLDLPDDRPTILFASKLIVRKHPDVLLRAAAQLQREGAQFSLLIVGSGPLEVRLRTLSHDLGLTHVRFAGFVNQTELPAIYGAVDIFVLPSSNEPWGLVVNEVMCAELPIVVSKKIGCVADLVVNGMNGFLVEPGDVDSLVVALRKLIVDPRLRAQMGHASGMRIRQWGYRECLAALRHAIVRVESRRNTANRI